MKYDTPLSEYNHIWHKYRPVILKMMIDSNVAAQHYVFSKHEFKRVHPKSAEKLAFLLYLRKSKALNNIRTSGLAKALLAVLQQSKTAVDLTSDSTYEILFDDSFVLHIKKAGVENGIEVQFQPNDLPFGTEDVTKHSLPMS